MGGVATLRDAVLVADGSSGLRLSVAVRCDTVGWIEALPLRAGALTEGGCLWNGGGRVRVRVGTAWCARRLGL